MRAHRGSAEGVAYRLGRLASNDDRGLFVVSVDQPNRRGDVQAAGAGLQDTGMRDGAAGGLQQVPDLLVGARAPLFEHQRHSARH